MEIAPLDYKLAIFTVATYGLLLVYAFQIGFFTLIGFHYAGLSGTLSFWTNSVLALTYAIPTAAAFLILLIVFQVSSQAGFNLVRWTADHESLLLVIFSVVLTLPSVILVWMGKSPHLFLISVVANFIALVAIVYCSMVAYQRIPVWSAIFAAIFPIVLVWMLGFYSAYYARILEPHRFDIVLENGRLNSVRLIRSSSTGIIYAEGEDGKVSFVSIAKVVTVGPTSR